MTKFRRIAGRFNAGWWGLGLAIALGGLSLPGCDDNPSTTPLTAPGGRGGIEGTLVFPAGTDSGQVATVVAAPNEAPDCQSAFGAIALMGDFNAFDLAEAGETLMFQLAPCVWAVRATLPSGPQNFKFVTGNDAASLAFDTPGDYGRLGPGNGTDPLSGSADNPAPGDDGNISLTLPTAGEWTVILNETAVGGATYRFTLEEFEVNVTAANPMFRFSDLPVGTYDLTIASDGFVPQRFERLQVKHNTVILLDSIVMETAQGFLTGGVDFADSPDPRPTATVRVLENGVQVPGQVEETTGLFLFAGLATGTYDLALSAPGYLDTTLVDIAFVNGQNTDVGTVTLRPGCTTTVNTIQIVGQFDPDCVFNPACSSFMTNTEGCVWMDTLTVTAGSYLFKFVTNGAFDNPEDYGGTESQVLSAPGTFDTRLASGEGTALNVDIPADGDWEFVLDESRLQFTLRLLGDAPGGAINGSVSFQGVTSAPFPRATVQLLSSPGNMVLRTATSSTETGAYAFELVADGRYNLRAFAACFDTSTVNGIPVSGGPVFVPIPELTPGGSTLTSISLAGDFNGFDLAANPMTQDTDCVWTAQVDLAVGTFNLKFVTNGAFDSPPDYGGDETPLDVPGTHPVSLVTGIGTAITIVVAEPGSYVFTLDERQSTFSVEPAAAGGPQ